ncbi:MAG TPA: phosphoribosylaminoimidazolesuccinocarboxamide synthase [Nitrospiria bacterium]|nr:phosphoribosylaminoimidazolesuccinocarboxamide synthase [Nitrospiria bacterium]
MLGDLGPRKQGKVRDIYDLGETLLLVATDRISAFDVVLPEGIPGKGYVLTQLSRFWFEWFDRSEEPVSHHLITTEAGKFPESCRPYLDILSGRSMLVKKVDPLPVECIVRGYISGSGWKEYKKAGTVCGQRLPEGLLESQRLEETIFTPSTKAEEGHDENISFEKMVDLVGSETAEDVRKKSLSVYGRAAEYAAERGIIIADTKFEFGRDPRTGKIILIDEVLTPDSSRFWPREEYKPGGPQPSFDKQFVRDYLDSVNWDHNPPAPNLPDDIVKKSSRKYLDALSFLSKE